MYPRAFLLRWGARSPPSARTREEGARASAESAPRRAAAPPRAGGGASRCTLGHSFFDGEQDPLRQHELGRRDHEPGYKVRDALRLECPRGGGLARRPPAGGVGGGGRG